MSVYVSAYFCLRIYVHIYQGLSIFLFFILLVSVITCPMTVLSFYITNYDLSTFIYK